MHLISPHSLELLFVGFLFLFFIRKPQYWAVQINTWTYLFKYRASALNLKKKKTFGFKLFFMYTFTKIDFRPWKKKNNTYTPKSFITRVFSTVLWCPRLIVTGQTCNEIMTVEFSWRAWRYTKQTMIENRTNYSSIYFFSPLFYGK